LPCVSVVIPTYNHSSYVLETLESVFAQSFGDYEVIVINDGSPDRTAELLQPLARQKRIRYFEQANAGQSVARNRGIVEAHGEFIAFLDDDDLWPPDKLHWQVAAARQNPGAAMVWGPLQVFGERDGDLWPHECDAPSGEVLNKFLRRNWIQSPGQTLIPRALLQRVGGLDSVLWGADDWDLYIRLARVGPFVYKHKLALRYRCHADNASKNYWRLYRNARRVLHKHLGLLPRPSNIEIWNACRRFVQDFSADDAIRAAYRFADEARWGDSRRAWMHAWWIRPGLRKYRRYMRRIASSFTQGRVQVRRSILKHPEGI